MRKSLLLLERGKGGKKHTQIKIFALLLLLLLLVVVVVVVHFPFFLYFPLFFLAASICKT